MSDEELEYLQAETHWSLHNDLARLIADYRRMRDAIRQRPHGNAHSTCHWTGDDLARKTWNCTPETCIWREVHDGR